MRKVKLQKGALKVGIAQINPTLGDYEANRKVIVETINQAEKNKYELLVFSVLPCSGSPLLDLTQKENFISKGIQYLKSVAHATKGKKLVVLLSFIEKYQKEVALTVAIVREGVVTPVLRKEFSSVVPKKPRIFRVAGTGVFATLFAEQDDPAEIKRLACESAKQGAKLLVVLSEEPFYFDEAYERESVFRRIAKESRMNVLFVNQVGGQDELVFDGRSLAIDSAGNVFSRCPAFKEGLFDALFDLKRRRERHISLPAQDKVKDLYDALVLGVRDYARKNGFEKAIVGLSGGIDSALTATIARDALTSRNVIGVSMPGPYSSPSSVDDAKLLAEEMGIELIVRPIGRVYEVMLEEIANSKQREGRVSHERKTVTVSMENMQARLRGVELMYLSNDEQALVLSTGNKSEAAMGYCTLYGDTCGGLNVLGDVYKTDVYRLAYYRNSIEKMIPDSIIDKAPSAELRPNQKDEDALPPYDILDDILRLYLDGKKHSRQIEKALKGKVGHELISNVLWRVDHNEYKRRQCPPTICITRRSWMKRRMPITNRFGA